MARVGELEHEYLGYSIAVAGFTELRRLAARVDIWLPATNKEYDDPQVSFIEQLSSTLKRRSRDWPDDDAEAVKAIMDRGFHRARGAILLDRVPELDGQQFYVSEKPAYAQRSEEYLRGLVLNAFKRVFRHDADKRGRIDFDDVGVALVEGIDQNEVVYTLRRLETESRIQGAGIVHEAGARMYQPTAAGLREADALSSPDLAPGLLVEETVGEVERRLNRHSPDLVRRFRELFLKVVEPGQLTHLDVGEIAQTCDLLLQEFLDLPIIWEGVTEERPPRDKTKDRLSVILRTRVSSETEEGLITGLGDYLFGWFGPLDKFVNKHRHPLNPELSQRLHAKRLVIYTYLLVGDLIELLDL